MADTRDYLLVVDQSTSGTKALLVDRSGEPVARASREHAQHYPRPGWVEHDPVEIYGNVVETARAVLRDSGIPIGAVAGLTLTNQRETALIWDRETGLPVHRAIVWQCSRTADRCAELTAAGHAAEVRERTGLMLDPYFSATKFRWLLDHADQARELLAQGRLLAGTIDSWLIWKLTGGAVHATDYTNASRTSLLNIHSLEWDERLSLLFGVPLSLLPEVKASDASYGATLPELLGESLPISGVIGDSQAALFGHLCLEPGSAKATYGTGTSVLMNTGDRPVDGGEGLVTAVAWGAGGKVTYALEAIIRSSGDTLKWARENLGLFADFDELSRLLDGVPSSEGAYLVPAFVGMGAPHWDPYARAAIVGMHRGTHRGHIARAAIESIAYQVRDAAEFMRRRSGIPLRGLRADGGASSNDRLMQFQADILGEPVLRSDCAELSALGSAYLGGLGLGFWADVSRIRSAPARCALFRPAMDAEAREAHYAGWQAAVGRVVRPAQADGSPHAEIPPASAEAAAQPL